MRETAALSSARHSLRNVFNKLRKAARAESWAPRSTVRSRRATSWRRRELKPAVPQVTGRCGDHGMRLLLLLALPASGGISRFSLIHLEMSIHSVANMPSTSKRLASIRKCWNLRQSHNKLVLPFGLGSLDEGWFPAEGWFGRFLEFMNVPVWQLWQVYTWFSISVWLWVTHQRKNTVYLPLRVVLLLLNQPLNAAPWSHSEIKRMLSISIKINQLLAN